MKVEVGSGQRPTPGYYHSDVTKQVDLDFHGPAWLIDVPDSSVEEVLALGVIEHMRYSEVKDSFFNVARMLSPDGVFLFDVPDLGVWCDYLVRFTLGDQPPFGLDHILATLYGWQRWEGDEHKSGWTVERLESLLHNCGFTRLRFGVEVFHERGHHRRRMDDVEDAHIYVEAAL